MSDDKSNRRQRDRLRINIYEDFEVRYWSKEPGITPDKLKEKVQQLGASAQAVRQAVERKNKSASA